MTHINYELEADKRTWWLNNTGGAVKENLTVRDYFAAKAMIGLEGEGGAEYCATWAYRMADAMMKARELDQQGEL